jgi:hypothetical protein
MGEIETRLSVGGRVLTVIQGREPDRIVFWDRLELWRTALIRQGRLPAAFAGLSWNQCHRNVGMGEFKFVGPYDYQLWGRDDCLGRRPGRPPGDRPRKPPLASD